MKVNEYRWVSDIATVDWQELSDLYRNAPLGERPPAALATVFGNNMFTRFVYASDRLVGAGRALADGLDCAYIADVAVYPDHQGRGLGKAIVRQLVYAVQGHKKIILYANPRDRGLLPRPWLPEDEHRHGDLAGPGSRHRSRRSLKGLNHMAG